jgi:chromosome segregation ATPase
MKFLNLLSTLLVAVVVAADGENCDQAVAAAVEQARSAVVQEIDQVKANLVAMERRNEELVNKLKAETGTVGDVESLRNELNAVNKRSEDMAGAVDSHNAEKVTFQKQVEEYKVGMEKSLENVKKLEQAAVMKERAMLGLNKSVDGAKAEVITLQADLDKANIRIAELEDISIIDKIMTKVKSFLNKGKKEQSGDDL